MDLGMWHCVRVDKKAYTAACLVVCDGLVSEGINYFNYNVVLV